jgi:hypothetical protein
MAATEEQQPAQTEEVQAEMVQSPRGIKRPRLETGADEPAPAAAVATPQPVHEFLTPRTASRTATPELNKPEMEMQYFDDNVHDDYEWVRLPKKRNYDIYPVPRDMNLVSTWEIPLTAVDHESQKVTLWATLDTGSSINLIELSTLKKLFGPDHNRHLKPATTDHYNLIAHAKWDVKHSVNLAFTAGVPMREFTHIKFSVVDQEAEDADSDGVPNVLLGHQFLTEHNMIHKNIQFCHNAEEGQKVLAPRAQDEVLGLAGPLPIVVAPKRPGVRRPTR